MSLHCGRRIAWLAAAVVATAAVATAAARAERLPIRRYTVADGLAHDHIEAIRSDPRGFLWFATDDGLSHFDGRSFTSYGFPEGLVFPRVIDFLARRDGTYLMALAGGGVNRFEPVGSREGQSRPRFDSYDFPENPPPQVTRLFQDRAGRVWAGTLAGLYRLETDGAKEVFRPHDLAADREAARRIEVSDLADDGEGGLWVGTNSGLFRLLADGHRWRTPILAEVEDRIFAVIVDGAGRVWLGHRRGLFVLAPEPGADLPPAARPCRDANGAPRLPDSPGELCRYTTADGLGFDDVRALLADGDTVWIGTSGGGVTRWDGRRFRTFTEENGLAAQISALAVDRGGHLWIGTPNLGALRMSASGFETFLAADGLGNEDVMRIFETQGGELAAVGAQWSLSWLELGPSGASRFRTVRPNLPRPMLESSRSRWEILQDHAGGWWAATGQGLYRFPSVGRLEDLATTTPAAVYTTRDGLPDDLVSRLFEDSRGDLWISSYHPPVMLARWERATGRITAYSEADGLPADNWANVFAEDARGNLWLGLHNGGLARRRAGRFEVFGEADGVPRGLMQGLYRDSVGRLWIATGAGGAGRVDDPDADRPSFVTYTMTDRLSSNNLRCFAEDSAGHVYLGTARGLDRLDVASGRVEHETAAADLPASELTAAFVDSRGTLWLGTHSGLVRRRPVRRAPAPPPEVWLRRLAIAGVDRPLFELGVRHVGGLVLGPAERQIEVEYFAVDYAADRRLGFQHRFDGAEWSPLTEQRTLAANLAPGRYRLEVRAVRDDGAASPEPATLELEILPPLWQRGWFLAALALAAGAAGYLAYRQRVGRLLALERVRTRIATDLHDDIGASLSRIAILSEVVKQSAAARDPEAQSRLGDIADSARGLIDAMSDIVWSIDPRKDRLDDLARRVNGFASDVLEPRGIRWRAPAPAELDGVKLAPEARRHLLLIAKEAIHNVLRHSEAREAALEIAVSGRELRFAIADDGAGFDPDAAPSPSRRRGGHGLPSLAERARELGGTCTVDAAPGRGTRIEVRMPLGRRMIMR